MAKHPEDRHDWTTKKTYLINVCRKCKLKILVHHCEETGCPWCSHCFEK